MKVKRFDFGTEYRHQVGTPAMTEQDDGCYVLYSDYEALRGLPASAQQDYGAPKDFKTSFPDGALSSREFHDLWAAPTADNPTLSLGDRFSWHIGMFADRVAKAVKSKLAQLDDRSDWCRISGCSHKNAGSPVWETSATSTQSSLPGGSHREWRFAIGEAIDVLETEIDCREDDVAGSRMKRARSVLLKSLSTPPATNGQAQQEAHRLLVDLVNQIRKTNPVDDHGHALTMNMAYMQAVELLDRQQQDADKVDAQQPFQARVQPWMLECFGPAISADRGERNHRFIEEALELAQACGCSASEAHQLVDYVFARPVGEPYQEVGGVMVTLAALCLANGLDMHDAGETELARIWTKVDQIRAKQAAKPKHSPLPMAAQKPDPAMAGDDRAAFEALVRERNNLADGVDIVKLSDGTYASPTRQKLWEYWQVACKRIQPASEDDVRDAARWRWARSVLLAISYQSGQHGSNRSNVCPVGEANTVEFWDALADNAADNAMQQGGQS